MRWSRACGALASASANGRVRRAVRSVVKPNARSSCPCDVAVLDCPSGPCGAVSCHVFRGMRSCFDCARRGICSDSFSSLNLLCSHPSCVCGDAPHPDHLSSRLGDSASSVCSCGPLGFANTVYGGVLCHSRLRLDPAPSHGRGPCLPTATVCVHAVAVGVAAVTLTQSLLPWSVGRRFVDGVHR